jgi:hypothetical protein
VVAVMTKPSGLLAALAASAVAGAWWWRGRTTSAAALTLIRSVVCVFLASWAVFYAWSPTHLSTAQGARERPLLDYAASVVARVPAVWLEYWGKLGWLEYRLSDPWHWGLGVVLVACGVLAIRRRAFDPGYATWMLAVGAVFSLLTVAAEYLNHGTGGLILQGRYFLPAALAMAPIAMQRWPIGSFTVPAYLALMNVALLPLTVERYFGSSLDALWQSMAFWRP